MTSAAELAARRYSCRDYVDRPLGDHEREALTRVLESSTVGPLGNKCRFVLVAATQEDREALKGLGTYGFIKGATGFVVGTVSPGPGDMEDYGYCLETVVLEATGLGLGTCWLGGTFTRSAFARKMGASKHEVIPAVLAIGYPTEGSRDNRIRRAAGGERRLPPRSLFFDKGAQAPLAADAPDAGGPADALEAVRWAPSASNKQPWRLVRDGQTWHFYLERTPGYRKGMFKSLLGLADLQRVDMGIAICHFDRVARESGAAGHWTVQPPPAGAAESWEYIASWAA